MAASSIRQDVFNLPNMLTWLRVAVIPIFMWLLYRGDPLSCTIAAVIFTLAAITDFVDGYLARRLNLVSLTGKFLDPLADKLIITAALIMLTWSGDIQAWLTTIIICREITITALRAIAGTEGILIKSDSSARLKTAFQLVGVLGMIIHFDYNINFLYMQYDINFHIIGYCFTLVSVALGLWSAFFYFADFIRGIGAAQTPPAA